MPISYSKFASSLTAESAFTVLSVAKQLIATGKDVIELEIGDSPFPSPKAADDAVIQAIREGQTRYCSSLGLPEFRQAAADFVGEEFGIPAAASNIAVAPGAKPFEQFFCETFLNEGDGVLAFGPQFPTYQPNILRRGARMISVPLKAREDFRPQVADVEQFLEFDPSPKAIFLNSPHNPTGGVATKRDLEEIANVLRGRDIAIFSDEPYCHMVWNGKHHSIAAEPGMLNQCVAAYTFSKSYSMSGWRLGFCVASQQTVEMMGTLINTALSCTPPFVQLAGIAAIKASAAQRDQAMKHFNMQVSEFSKALDKIDGIHAQPPAGTFYVFASVETICKRHRITSHGLAMYLLEAADEKRGVACLGGECFGPAGQGFLRFSCAQPSDRLMEAAALINQSIRKPDKIDAYLAEHPEYQSAPPE